MGYTKCIVFFLDILGSQDRNSFEILYKINSIFHNELEEQEKNNKILKHSEYERKVYTFSDCAYIIYYFTENNLEKDFAKLFNTAASNTELLILEFISNGFLVRGGVTLGDVYFEKQRSLFFGPAINTAYKIESTISNFPRIVIDDSLIEIIGNKNEELLNNFKAFGFDKEYYDNFLIEEGIGEIIKKDTDNYFYLNYLNSMQMGIRYQTKNGMDLLQLNDYCKAYTEKEINDLKNKIELTKEIELQKKLEKILIKQSWFYEYLITSTPKKISNIISIRNTISF